MMLRAAFVPPQPVIDELRAVVGRLAGLPGVRPTPWDVLDIPAAGFGNVTSADARRLRGALTRRLGERPAPVVRFDGVSVGSSGEVVALLSGEVDELAADARAVAQAAASVQLFVDRRSFRAGLEIASISTQAPGSQVPAMIDAATLGWTGMAWEASGVSLIRTRWFAGGALAEEIDYVELGLPADVPSR